MPCGVDKDARRRYGNSKVLSPEFRDPLRAYQVGRWLTEKSVARLRRDGRVAARFSLDAAFLSDRRWSRAMKCFPSQDTAFFFRIHRALWRAMWRAGPPGKMISLGVHLGDIGLLVERRGDLLRPVAPAERTRGENVTRAVDQINARFGDGMIRCGTNTPHPGFFERG